MQDEYPANGGVRLRRVCAAAQAEPTHHGCFMISSIASFWLFSMSATMGVSIVPGHTALMRTPGGAVLERGALGRPEHPVLGRVVGRSLHHAGGLCFVRYIAGHADRPMAR